ncbi:MAG TPA: AAA family ATPase [Candidatus Binatia bacterium]
MLPDSLFCHACGKPLTRQETRLAHGERKPITVLFVDAFGSIALGDRLDNETWHDVVERFFAIVSAAVRRYGGTVDRLTGGGIKVLFGAPTALESHARQACHAALHIARELADFAQEFRKSAGVEFSVRMGLNSGEVVFGPVGGDSDTVFTSQGHTAALAARMQQLAGPGQIYLTARTASLVADFFELRDVGARPVRNASASVRIYELIRAREHRSRLDAARERGLSRFVGRARDMAKLEEALRSAHASGPRVIGITGEPGVGKSRLGDEFAERQRSHGLSVHHTRCVEHGAWIPFHAALPFIRSELGIATDDDPELVRERVTRRLLALDPTLEEALPVLLAALGVAPPERRNTGSAANDLARICRTLIEAHDPLRPSVLLIDDAQWMDAASAAVFEHLVEEPPRQAVVVVVSYRRGFRRRWMDDPSFSEIVLQPLDRRATLELVRSLLGSDASLGGLADRIVDRAGGNPFFVEEMVHALVESEALEGERGAYRPRKPVSDVRVPDSLQAVLAARIDQLSDVEKTVLQAASVIGRELDAALLADVTGLDASRVAEILETLDASDFFDAPPETPSAEAVYGFRHPLLRETAYRSLLQERRAELHRRVARALLSRHGAAPETCAAQLALHYEAAGELREAALWHRSAASHTEPWDPVQSLEHWRRVFGCTAGDDGDEARRHRLAACEAIVRLGVHQGVTAEQARPFLREGQSLAMSMGETRATALLLSAEATFLGATGDIAGSIEHNARALALATRSQDDELALLCGARLTLGYRMSGDLRAALTTAEATLAAHRDGCRAPTPGWMALHQLELARIGTLFDLGRLELAASELERVVATLRGQDAGMVLGWALSLASTAIRFTGMVEPHLVASVEEGYALARRLAVPSLLARAAASVSVTRLFQGRAAEAQAHAQEAGRILRGAPHAFYVDLNPPLLVAQAQLALGEHTAARAAAHEALAYAIEHGSRLGELDAELCLGRILVVMRDPADLDEVRRRLVRGLALVHRTRARSREPHLWLALAYHARHRGDETRARTYQRRALRQMRAMRALGHLRLAARLRVDEANTAHRDGAPASGR